MEPLLWKDHPTSICRCQDSLINPELEKADSRRLGDLRELDFARLFIRMNFCPAGLAWIFLHLVQLLFERYLALI